MRCGGGFNHRFGLYDRFLIKDNHLALMESSDRLAEAVRAARALDPEAIHLPGVYVQRLICGAPYNKKIEFRTVREREAV